MLFLVTVLFLIIVVLAALGVLKVRDGYSVNVLKFIYSFYQEKLKHAFIYFTV